MERIKFEAVKKKVQEIFSNAFLENWDLIPSSIHQLAATQGTHLDWKKVPNWTDFEEARRDFEEDEFLKLAFYKHKPEGLIYLVTDYCFKTREAYGVDSKHLLNFVKNIDQLENEFQFVQPMDYVFINPDQKLITLIHHEGLVTQYKR